MSDWIADDYNAIRLNDDIIMSEPTNWSIACRFPSEGTAKALYYFEDYTGFSSNLTPSDDETIASESGKQEVIVPFYSHKHNIVANMVSDRDLSTNFVARKLAYVRAESFVRSVRKNTDDTDLSWSVVYRFTNLKYSSSVNKEVVYEIVGKIENATILFSPKSHKNYVQVSFVVAEDNETEEAQASTRWFDTNYFSISSGSGNTINNKFVQTEPTTNWSVSCRYPYKDEVWSSYVSRRVQAFFKGFLSLQSTVNASDQEVVPFEEGGQEVVVPFYTHEHRLSLVIVAGEHDNNTGQVGEYGWAYLPFYKAEQFIRNVRSSTINTDDDWELIFRFTDLTLNATPSPYQLLGVYNSNNKEPVLKLVGKIKDVTLNVQKQEQSRTIQIDFTFVEDTVA